MALPNRKELEAFIASAQLTEAIELLLQPSGELDEETRLQVIALSGRLRNLSDKELGGLLSAEDIELERNRISRALLDLIAAIPKNQEEAALVNKRRTQKKLLQATAISLYLGLAAAALWWALQPKPGVRVFADLLVDRLSFRYVEGPATFTQGAVRECSWQNGKLLQLEADQLLIDEDLDQSWEESLRPAAPIQIYPDPGVPGLSLQFGPARMERFLLQSGSFLTLSRPARESSVFRITTQQESELNTEWTFSDSLLISAELITLKGLGADRLYEYPTAMLAVPPPGLAREIQLSGFPGTTTIDLLFLDSLALESKDLLIDEVSFYQPVDNAAVPTTRSGAVRIAETEQSVWKTLHIKEGEALDLLAVEPMQLSRLKIGPQGIALSLMGRVKTLAVGGLEDGILPLRLEWFWQNKRLLTLALGALAVLISWFFFAWLARTARSK